MASKKQLQEWARYIQTHLIEDNIKMMILGACETHRDLIKTFIYHIHIIIQYLSIKLIYTKQNY
jgi:hypothetical protein